MDNICLPLRYDELTESDVQAHLRYCATRLADGKRAEFLLCEVGVVIPMVKQVYRTKPPTLDVLIRSGSIRRDQLIKLRARLSGESYTLKLSFTSVRKSLSRIIVPLTIDDGTVAVVGLNVLRLISAEVGVAWPGTMAVGYAVGSESQELPGRLTYRDSYGNSGYQLGLAVGK